MKDNLRARMKVFTRERIVEAAIEAFASQGFRETRVEDIAERVGTTVATFYRYFPSKGDLMIDVQGHLTAEVRACLEKMTREDIRSPEALRRWLDDYIEMWTRNHRLCDAFWEATTADQDFANRIFPAAFNSHDLIEPLIAPLSEEERGRLRIRLGLIVASLDRFVFLMGVAKDEALIEQIKDEIAGIMWDCIFAGMR